MPSICCGSLLLGQTALEKTDFELPELDVYCKKEKGRENPTLSSSKRQESSETSVTLARFPAALEPGNILSWKGPTCGSWSPTPDPTQDNPISRSIVQTLVEH